MLKKSLEWVIPVTLAGLIAGCATYRPPEQIQSATSTLNRYTPEYVREANKALIESKHPDAERLVGIGLRLQKAIDSLDSWANRNPEENEQ